MSRPKRNRGFTITITVDPAKVKRGHQHHRSGAGVHQDRRTRRQRTRGTAIASYLKD